MENNNFHPLVTFSYFVFVILFSMIFMHPILLLIAFCSAFILSIQLNGRKGLKFNTIYLLPMMIFMVVLNPLFNHQGATILFYMKNGNPITLESILFGMTAALMFVTIIMWFSCYNKVMTSDKTIFLFGKIMPSLSLVIAMVLRFVPRYKAQIKEIANAQMSIGRNVSQGNLINKAKNGINILSIMTTWALENGVDTADSMRARGYGLSGRTNFSLFSFEKRDLIGLLIISFMSGIVLLGVFFGQNTLKFFPKIEQISLTPFAIFVYITYFFLCMLPIFYNVWGEVKWKYLMSKM